MGKEGINMEHMSQKSDENIFLWHLYIGLKLKTITSYLNQIYEHSKQQTNFIQRS